MAVEIPLFPLGVVLFPHMPLPLHIFEERYRQMMRDCEEQGTGFGIVAIREGVEVQGPATPHPVGTLAQMRKVERLDDGRGLPRRFELEVAPDHGRGWGLPALLGRAQALGGDVSLFNNDDGGATLRVVIPTGRAHAGAR